jgi:hypothetical protein
MHCSEDKPDSAEADVKTSKRYIAHTVDFWIDA